MTESIWDEEITETEDHTPKALRSAYEAMKKQNQELAKQLQAVSSEVRKTKLESTFAEKGLPRQAADLFPKDVDVSEDSVKQWLDAYGNLFNNPVPSDPVQDAPVTPPVNPIAAPLEQMNNVVTHSAPATTPVDFEKTLANPNLLNEMSLEDFEKELRKAQGLM